MAWLLCWMIALSTADGGAAEATDRLTPPGWSGNPWGPAAIRARLSRELPPIPQTPLMASWEQWGARNLREGDIVFRRGDARTLKGWFPLSHLIAEATASPFSHTGIVAIEQGAPVIYDCSSSGIQQQPFSVWMLDCVGSFGVKRLREPYRAKIPGVIAFCRDIFQKQLPFDFEFRLDDTKFYCLELTEKAFRSQGLPLSEPVCIGDWERLPNYPLTAYAFLQFSGWMLQEPISLDQKVYLPGNDHSGVWASPYLETVLSTAPRPEPNHDRDRPVGLHMGGDLSLTMFVIGELRRSYSELPIRWICNLVLKSQSTEPAARATDDRQASLPTSPATGLR